MPSDQVVREQLLALLIGGNAHMTFEQAVADFPAEYYNTNPPNITYTPWHILEHLRIAQWDILEFIRKPDHVSPEWPKGYWPDPNEMTGQEGWARLKEMELFEAIRLFSVDPSRSGRLGAGRTYTYSFDSGE